MLGWILVLEAMLQARISRNGLLSPNRHCQRLLLTDEIPEEVLLRLPEWSIYVEMQGESVSGFFSSLEYVSPGKAELSADKIA